MNILKKIGKALLAPIAWTLGGMILGVLVFLSFVLMGFIIAPIAIMADNTEGIKSKIEEHLKKLK